MDNQGVGLVARNMSKKFLVKNQNNARTPGILSSS